jgi:chemotaxis protein histidine kinase CheA
MRSAFLVAFLFALCISAIGQQPEPPAAWDVTLQQNVTAASNLTVVNQCRRTHRFSIQPQNVPFLIISQSQVQVGGRQTVNVPVQFNTHGIEPGRHQGQVIVACLTCSSEPTCAQDRELLRVIANITPAPIQPGQPPTGQQVPPGSPTETGTPGEPPRAPGNDPNDLPDDGQYRIPDDNDEWWSRLDRARVPRLDHEYSVFQSGPCPELEIDCERLRRAAAELELTAANAGSNAERLASAAANAEQKAAEADSAANRAEGLVKQEGPVTTVVDGEQYIQADSDHLGVLRKRNQDDYLSGRINETEYQRRANELTTKKAREERLAEQEKLKRDAEAARRAAENARAEADKLRAAADAARNAAQEAESAARNALDAYRKCLKAIEDECLRLKQAQAAEEKRKRDEEAAAEAARLAEEKSKADEEKRRQDAENAARAQQEEFDYLIDNIKKLGLITYTPKTSIPGALDWFFDSLQHLTGQTVRDFLQTVAGQIGGGPISPDVVNALGELYKTLGSFFDIRTKAGKDRALRNLQEMTNPKTGRKYTLDEALNKIGRMEALMRRLQDKLNEARREAERQSRSGSTR